MPVFSEAVDVIKRLVADSYNILYNITDTLSMEDLYGDCKDFP